MVRKITALAALAIAVERQLGLRMGVGGFNAGRQASEKWSQKNGLRKIASTKKPRRKAGALKFLTQGVDQYFATTGPVQLKR